MLKISLIVAVLLVAGIHSEKRDAYRSNIMDNHSLLGKIRLSHDGEKDELIRVIPAKADLPASGQPLPSPCTGFRAKTKIAHPTDKSKYIQCRDEFHYDVFACPQSGQYNEEIGACEMIVQVKDRCEEEKPCLNDGICSIVSNSTFKCTCRTDWTGDRCEIPMNSCVMKPCGPTGECRSLKTTDSEQDYICLCRGRKEYGYNCQDVVPSPCITGEEQFFPFAFSPRAYIQCDGELIYFQSCGSLLYWNQEEKYCDRKRAHAVDTKLSVLKPLPNPKIEDPRQVVPTDESEELTTLPSTTSTVFTKVVEPVRFPGQRPRIDSEPTIVFAPSRVAQRRPLPVEGNLPISSFPEQRVPESQFNVKPIQASFETSTAFASASQRNGQGFVRINAPGVLVESINQNNQFVNRPRVEPTFPTITFTQLPETTTRFTPIEPIAEEAPVRTWQAPARADRFRADHQYWFTVPTTPSTTIEPLIKETNFDQSFTRVEGSAQSQQQSQWFNSNNQRYPETTTIGQNLDRVAVTNEERLPQGYLNRFRAEASFPTTFIPSTTTPAPLFRESFFDSSASRGGADYSAQQPQRQSWFNQNGQRFPETTTVGQNLDRVAVTNEERIPQGFVNQFRAEASFPTTFIPSTTTPAPLFREPFFDSPTNRGGDVSGQQRPSWFSNTNNQRVQPTQNYQNALIEPTTLATNIIRGASAKFLGFGSGNVEQQGLMRDTITTTPASFPTRPWPANSYTVPSWEQRQRQALAAADSSLIPAQTAGRRIEQNPVEKAETLTTTTETLPINQPGQTRLPNAIPFESTTVSNGEFHQGFNAWRAVPTSNQRRSQDLNMLAPPSAWKSRS